MYRILLSLTFAVALMAAATNTYAFTNTLLDNDADFNALVDDEIFVAEVRNAVSTGDWEYDLRLGNTFAGQEQQFTWTSGAAVPFSLEFDAAGNASFTFNGDLLTLSGLDPIGAIGVRARSTSNNAANSVLVDFTTPDVDDVFAEDGEVFINVLTDLPTPLFLEGFITFTFDPSDGPTKSNLAVQFKGITTDPLTQPIPVPGAVWLLGVGLAGLAARMRRS